ncbi:hypothetical protein BKH43_06960 [Helicobacter sp. 13S00401-1]|uniref:hypothetical protein n=1 Tax=Helicobacter sp. 13S00401-1 TaxID=1905758 RepID=UPI000BA730C7|nr:hypothetical protein [Helicobacter sp. 13S00401-1]PAF49315.1 hypothetical protein BKH43_06960 [Helicobacter sp. 13S00401-1]
MNTNELDKLTSLILSFHNAKRHANKLIKDDDPKSRGLKSSFARMESILQTMGFEILDYTGSKYNEGMNIDVLDTLYAPLPHAIISEVLEPSIIYQGKLINKSKVIKTLPKEICKEDIKVDSKILPTNNAESKNTSMRYFKKPLSKKLKMKTKKLR